MAGIGIDRPVWRGRALAAAAIVTLTAPLIVAQAPASFSPLDLRVAAPPRPLHAAGRAHLAYEVHIANMAARPALLDVVEVRDPSRPDGSPLLRLQQDGLAGAIRRFGAPPDDRDQRLLGAGQSAVLFVWLSLDAKTVPRRLTHHIALRLTKAGGAGADSIDVDGLDVRVDSRMPRVIGPPLEGDHWLAANGPDNGAGHRRTTLSIGGEARIAQRFAIDWVRLYEEGRTFRGDPLKNSSYRTFGANVLAVADGVVVEALDEIPENVPDPVLRAVPMTPRTLSGNHVLLDIGDGAWAVYSHLQLGSVRVRKGEKVRRGQVLGLVGNTGNSTEPHLHFHVADRPNAIDSEGIPYAFARFDLEADGADVTRVAREVGLSLEIEAASVAEWWKRAPQTRRNELPVLNALVGFPRP